MIRGRFGDTTTAPYIEASVHFPRFGLRGYVSFLVDTGANGSVLLPADSKKLGVKFRTLKNPTFSHGIGGFAKGFDERSILAFSDGRYVYAYEFDIQIAAPTSENRNLPSLLGRDVLNRWRVVVDYISKSATFTPRNWDLRLKI
jgi:hypothetical protein